MISILIYLLLFAFPLSLVFHLSLSVVSHFRRSAIAYNNFNSYSKFYNIKIPNNTFYIAVGYTLLNLIIIMYISTAPLVEFKTYVGPLLLSSVFVFMIWYMWMTLKTKNIDLTYFNVAYRQVNDAFKTKEKAEELKSKTKTYLREYSKSFIQLEKYGSKFNKGFKVNNDSQLKRIADFIDIQDSKISKFSTNIIDMFNLSLEDFLTNNQSTPIVIPTVDLSFKQDMDLLQKELSKEREQLMMNEISSLMKRNPQKMKNTKNIVEALTFLTKENISLNKTFKTNLVKHSKGIEDPNELYSYMDRNSILNQSELVQLCISKKLYWFFGIIKYGSSKEYKELMSDVITSNSIEAALKFTVSNFSKLNSIYNPQIITTANTTTEFFDSVLPMSMEADHFYSYKAMYQNMASVVKNLLNKGSLSATEKFKYQNLENSKIYENKDSITKTYYKYKNKLNDLLSDGLEITIMYEGYHNSGVIKTDVIDSKKLHKVLRSAHNRILSTDVSVAILYTSALLLGSKISVTDKDKVKQIVERQQLNLKTTKSTGQKSILIQLFTLFERNLKNVIVLIENSRETMREIRTLSGRS